MKPVLKDQQHRNLTFWGMAMIAMGLPLSVFLVSVGVILLVINWILEGDQTTRARKFFTSPLSLSLVAFYLLLIVGLFWTEDLGQGLKELRIKAPLLVLPLVLFTSRMPDKRKLQDILLVFVVACCVGMLFGMATYFELTGEELLNKRHISVFISHIRFGLMLVMAFFILAYFLLINWKKWSRAEIVISCLTLCWILWFLVVLEALTAYLAFGAVFIFSSLRTLLQPGNRKLGIPMMAVTIGCLILATLYVAQIVNTHNREIPFDYRTLELKTVNGTYYAHQKDVLFTENGHRVWNFVCWEELEKEWPKRSLMDFNGEDLRGQTLKYTLIRYMASKGIPKDSLNFHQLSDEDIRHIEKGYTNHLYTGKLGIDRRISDILRGWDKYRYERAAGNSSSFQRIVYTEVGWKIFMENLLAGVGTGDLFLSYRQEYELDDRGLEPKFQNISHNQFLTVGILLGLLGVVIFLIMLVYPAWLYRHDYLYLVFLVLMLVSFLTDNTFDRQSGVTLFAYFNALLILRKEYGSV